MSEDSSTVVALSESSWMPVTRDLPESRYWSKGEKEVTSLRSAVDVDAGHEVVELLVLSGHGDAHRLDRKGSWSVTRPESQGSARHGEHARWRSAIIALALPSMTIFTAVFVVVHGDRSFAFGTFFGSRTGRARRVLQRHEAHDQGVLMSSTVCAICQRSRDAVERGDLPESRYGPYEKSRLRAIRGQCPLV